MVAPERCQGLLGGRSFCSRRPTYVQLQDERPVWFYCESCAERNARPGVLGNEMRRLNDPRAREALEAAG